MFDHKTAEMVDVSKYAKKKLKINSQMSASTLRESAGSCESPMRMENDSDSDSLEEDQRSENDYPPLVLPEVQKIKFKFGDKFTKKPIQHGKYLVMLGRIHIQLFDLETFETKILLSVGEDQAEKLGQLLKENPLMLQKKNYTEDDREIKKNGFFQLI